MDDGAKTKVTVLSLYVVYNDDSVDSVMYFLDDDSTAFMPSPHTGHPTRWPGWLPEIIDRFTPRH